MGDEHVCVLQACSQASMVEYTSVTDFVDQLQADPKFPGRTKLMWFPAKNVTVSVQAGRGFRSAYETDWGPREFPFWGCSPGALQGARATHYEVRVLHGLHARKALPYMPAARVQALLDALL